MKQIKGLKIFSINEVVERSIDDLKVNEVCMLPFNSIMSCCVVAGNMDHYFYLEKHDQRKDLLPKRRCKNAWVTYVSR